MNQFSSIYGQLFCCSCPGGLTGSKCDNSTGVVVSYPILPNSNYAWIAGLLSTIILVIIAFIIGIYCCKRRRSLAESDMISIIRIRAALFENERDLEQSTQALVPESFENPSFHEEDDNEKVSQSDTKICLMLSPSHESDNGSIHEDGVVKVDMSDPAS